MKNSATKTIVATGLGAALFMVLFMFVKVPSPVPETNLQIAYGVSAFFATLIPPTRTNAFSSSLVAEICP